jgi:uncharacterized membrane protein
MKNAFIAALLLVSVQAQADIIQCHFTEPFITTSYSMAQQSLTVAAYGDKTPAVIKNVSFQIKGPGKFELTDKDGKVLQALELNYKGSDGMSDVVYPYDAQYAYSGTQTLFGGCESNHQKRAEPKN